jgi:hypothetical protein
MGKIHFPQNGDIFTLPMADSSGSPLSHSINSKNSSTFTFSHGNGPMEEQINKTG